MKTKLILHSCATALLLTTFNSHLSNAFAQGALTPPGAPAATMKSLAQIEPRIPISTTPYIIFTPGSYYLTGNLTVSTGGAVAIAASNVTLDLNGFSISSTASPAAGTAIAISSGRVNVSIFNGQISGSVTNDSAGLFFGGSGFGSGILGTGVANVRVKAVSVSGMLTDGINLGVGNSSLVESCTVNVAGGYGIYAESVCDSVARNCGGYGISADTASNCKGYGIGTGYGIYGTTANNCSGSSSGSSYGVYEYTANNCYGQSFGAGSIGLYAITANNCVGSSFGSGGIGLSAQSIATGCLGSSNLGTGLSAFIANGCRGTSTSGTPLTVTHNVNSF